MTEDAFRLLIDDHARFPGALLAIFQGSDLELLRHRERPERWSPLEILAHLRDEEVEDFRPRAQAALAGKPIETGIDPQGWVTARRYQEMDPGAVVLDWANERGASCRWLATIDVADLDRALEHPKLGRMRAGDFIAAWRMHDLLHLKQFARAMAAAWGARLGGWRVDYAGTVPGRTDGQATPAPGERRSGG